MEYSAALQYLYSFIRNSSGGFKKDTPYETATARMRDILDRLGNPQNKIATIHVAGTKGKGSVSAMCAAMLDAAQFKVGLYTSPHLQELRERFRIGQQIMPEITFSQIVERIAPALEAVGNPTYFEATTALAFSYFQHENVDIAVIEVGVGGRLDATNVITPLISIITNLSMDHMELLGNSIEEIAAAKAGIIKPTTPVVCAPQPAGAFNVIEAEAIRNQSPLVLVGRDWIYETELGQTVTEGERFRAAPAGQPLKSYQVPLVGTHQIVNSVVSLAAIEQLSNHGLPVPYTAAVKGLREVNWTGRMEMIRRGDNQAAVLLDCAHNRDSITKLKETILNRFIQHPFVLVFGAKSTKEIGTMLDILLPLADDLILTQASGATTALPEAVETLARDVGYSRPIQLMSNVPAALDEAGRLAGKNGLICVTGSVYIVGEARTYFGLTPGQPVNQ